MNNNQDANYRKEKREKQFDEKVKLERRITELESRLGKVQSEKDSALKENERFRKGIERLFARIHVLEGRNAEGLKDYKQLKSEILSDEQSNYEEKRAKRL